MMKEALRSGIPLHGVELRRLQPNRDERGAFTEIFSQEWRLGIAPTQWSVVATVARALRGMHLHLRHDEYFCAVQGKCCVGLYDLRPESPTRGQHALIELEGDELACLVFPSGLVHGWYFFEDSLHLQAVSESYVSYHPDDNLTCYWADKTLSIPWPDTSPIVSQRAANAPSLEELARIVESNRKLLKS
jgi:dTDP-4-dehydrorhamnose 3,5-epimerase